MWRVENTLLCTLALTVPHFLVFLPFQAFFRYGLWIILVQLAALLILTQPISFCELALGQRSQKGPLKCWCFGPAWKGIGFLMLTTTAWEIISTNMDVLEYLRQKEINFLFYGQLIAWIALAFIIFLWPKVTGKVWILISLICFGGIVALAARSLTLQVTEASISRLWKLSSRLPENIFDLLRISLLPFLSSTGTGVLVTLGSYRSQKVNAFIDSGLMILFVFLFHILYTLSDSALLTFFCKTQSVGRNKTMNCNLENLHCPMRLLEKTNNSSCDFLKYYQVDIPDNAIESANMFHKLLLNLPKNEISPTVWVYMWYCVWAILYTTYIIVRVDTWVRALSDKLQGARVFKTRTITARIITSFFTCGLFGSLGFLADKYREVVNVQKIYQLSTVRWLPILLGALTCLAVVHGYGGIRFIKEIGGGITLRPWFFVLTGFITPALLIALGGLRMHESIEKLLQPSSDARFISATINLPNYVSLILAVSAFLFLLTGLFSPLIWHGVCRRQRCAQLVQPTKSWSLMGRTRSDSGGSGGDLVRDLGPASVEQTPMLGTLRHHSLQNSNPILSDSDTQLQTQIHQQHLPTVQHRLSDMEYYTTESGTVRFHPGNGVHHPNPNPNHKQPQPQYSTATLPVRKPVKSELRFALDTTEPGGVSGTKTLNRGILKNKHQGNYRSNEEETYPLNSNSNHSNTFKRGSDLTRNHSSEVL